MPGRKTSSSQGTEWGVGRAGQGSCSSMRAWARRRHLRLDGLGLAGAAAVCARAHRLKPVTGAAGLMLCTWGAPRVQWGFVRPHMAQPTTCLLPALLFIACPHVISGAAFQEELLIPSPLLAHKATRQSKRAVFNKRCSPQRQLGSW